MPCPRIHDTARIIGEPTLKFTPNGKACLELTLAFGDRRKNEQTGEWENGDTWWARYAQLWGAKAEAAAEVLHDKQLVMVAGKLRTEQWESNGEKKSRDRLVIVDIAQVVTARQGQQQRQSAPAASDPWNLDARDDAPPF